MTNEFIEAYISDAKALYVLANATDMDTDCERELRAELEAAILKDRAENPLIIHNNVTHTVTETYTDQVISLVYAKTYAMSAYGTLWHKHADNESPLNAFIIHVQNMRKVEKKLKFAHANDPDQTEYVLHDILQILYKLIINSYYGASGEERFIFFNPYVGPSVTYNGYTIITSGILYLEGLLSNNLNFETTDDVITFIAERQRHMEAYPEPISAWLDDPSRLTPDALVEYLTVTKACSGCVLDRDTIRAVVQNLDQEQINRVYYANNLYEFFYQSRVANIIRQCYDLSFVDPMSPPDAVKPQMETLCSLVRQYVEHPFIKFNRVDYLAKLQRKSILVVDTDSLFLYLKRFMTEVYNPLFNVPAELEDDPAHQIACTNIINNVAAVLIQDILDKVTDGLAVSQAHQSRIVMKSEFLFKRVMLTKNKKNYASVIMAQEGVVYGTPKLDSKGLAIKKVSCNKLTREYFMNILNSDILLSKQINPKLILRKYLEFESKVYESLTSKLSTEFLTPGKFTNFSVYKSPTSNSICKAVVMWNALNPLKKIQPYSKVFILPIRSIRTESDIVALKDKYPEQYRNLRTVFTENPEYFEKSGVSYIAIPNSVAAIPKELVEFMDVDKVVSGNTSPAYAILEAVGFKLSKSTGQRKRFSSFINL